MRRLFPAVIPMVLAGCFYPADRGRALEAKVDRLSADYAVITTELKETREKLAGTLPKIDEKVAEVSKALEDLDRAARRSGADIGVQLHKTVEDLAQLRGQVETYLHKISELEAALARLNEDTERRFVELKGEDAVKAAEARKKAEELKRPEDKGEFLALAESKAKAGEPVLARQLYSEWLKKWPKDERAGDAYFGRGETYFAEEKCREALHEYGKVIQEYGKAKSAPTAYLRSAECFQKLKMTDEAKLALEELIRQFPRSDAARGAKAKLQALNKGAKKQSASKKGKR